MSSDTLLGLLLGLPLYAIILFLFRDIVIKRFINKMVARAEIVEDNPNAQFGTDAFKSAIEADLLTSYKLLLVIQEEINFLKKTEIGTSLGPIYNERLKELAYTIEKTEQLFNDMGNKEYKQIKKNVLSLLKNNELF